MDDVNFAPFFGGRVSKKVKGAKSILRSFFVANRRCQFCAWALGAGRLLSKAGKLSFLSIHTFLGNGAFRGMWPFSHPNIRSFYGKIYFYWTLYLTFIFRCTMFIFSNIFWPSFLSSISWMTTYSPPAPPLSVNNPDRISDSHILRFVL